MLYEVITDSGKVVWTNEAFERVIQKEKGFHKHISSLFPAITKEKIPGILNFSDNFLDIRNNFVQHTLYEVIRYTIAVDRRRSRNDSDENTADFITCVAFGKQGEFVEKYCHKGTKLLVTGRIQTGSYTNKEGQKVYTTEVVVEELEFAESKQSASSDGGYQNNSGNRPAPVSSYNFV